MFEDYARYEYPLAQLQLVLFMLGLGLRLKVDDFRRVARRPGSLVSGLACLFVLSPLLAFLLSRWFVVEPGLAVGLALVAVMPGGALSKLFAWLGKGNVALSISLTACGTLGSVVAVPVALRVLAAEHVPEGFEVPIGWVVRDVTLYLLLPLVLGMVVGRRWPERRRIGSRGCIGLGLLVVIVMVAGAGQRAGPAGGVRLARADSPRPVLRAGPAAEHAAPPPERLAAGGCAVDRQRGDDAQSEPGAAAEGAALSRRRQGGRSGGRRRPVRDPRLRGGGAGGRAAARSELQAVGAARGPRLDVSSRQPIKPRGVYVLRSLRARNVNGRWLFRGGNPCYPDRYTSPCWWPCCSRWARSSSPPTTGPGPPCTPVSPRRTSLPGWVGPRRSTSPASGTNRKATGVHDPLKARAVVLRHGKEKVALVSIDLVGFFHANVQKVREQLAGFTYVLVSSTHNHEGPDTLGLWGPNPFISGVDPAYLKLVEEHIVAAVQVGRRRGQTDDRAVGDSEGARAAPRWPRALRQAR